MTYWQEVDNAKAQYDSALAKARAIWVESGNTYADCQIYEQSKLAAEIAYDSELSNIRNKWRIV